MMGLQADARALTSSESAQHVAVKLARLGTYLMEGTRPTMSCYHSRRWCQLDACG